MYKKKNDFIRIISFLKKKAPLYLFTTILDSAIVSVCYNIVLAVILKNVIDAVELKSISYLVSAFVIAGISFLFAIIVEPLIQRLNNYCIRHTMKIIRQTLFMKLMNIRVDQYEKMSDGDIMSKLTKNADMLEAIYSDQIPSLCFAILHGTIATFIMFYYSIFLGGVAVLFGIIAVLFNRFLSKYIQAHSEKYQILHGRMTQKIIDMMNGFTDIKMSRSEEYFNKKYEKENKELQSNEGSMEKYKNFINISNILFGHINNVGLMALALFLVFQGYTTIGIVIAVIRLQGNATYLFQNISGFIAGIKETMPSAIRIFEFLDIETGEELDLLSDRILDEKAEHIKMEQVEFCYQEDVPILSGFNVEIKHGEHVCIVGKSGSGKTTFAKILLGFYRPQKGAYLIDHMLTEQMSDDKIRSYIAYLDQESTLFQLTIEENIRLGNSETAEEDVLNVCRELGIHKFIINLKDGYKTIISENNDNISGGQKQRIALARALISTKSILLIDEGTSQLDPETEKCINQVLVSLKGRKTVIVITHKEQSLKYADKIIQF